MTEETSPNPLRLSRNDEYNLWRIKNSGVNPYEKEFRSLSHWHKFTIINSAAYSREEILRAVIEAANPGDLIPVKYRIDGKDSSFLARNCSSAIKALCDANLSIRLSNAIKLNVELDFNFISLENEPLVMHKHVHEASSKRLNMNEKTLDLSSYHKDPALKDIFCPLYIPKTLKYVILSTKQLSFENIVRFVNLSKNGITNIEALNVLKIFKNLIGVDLSNNLIEWDALFKFPRQSNIRMVWLSGNPLCSTFKTTGAYVDAVKKLIPSIDTLDGEDITSYEPELPFPSRTFLVEPGKSARFTDQFLHHYFGLFSSDDRESLKNMYLPVSAFSLVRVPSKTTGPALEMQAYTKHSRNLIFLSDYSKTYDNVFVGPTDIMGVLCGLPSVTFQRSTFTVDVPVFNERLALIFVTGLFTDNESGIVIYFSRAFTLTPSPVENDEWCIINDMMSVAESPPSHTNLKPIKTI